MTTFKIRISLKRSCDSLPKPPFPNNDHEEYFLHAHCGAVKNSVQEIIMRIFLCCVGSAFQTLLIICFFISSAAGYVIPGTSPSNMLLFGVGLAVLVTSGILVKKELK